MYYIGIDLGTSSLKLILVDDEGKVVLTEETTTVPNSKPQLTEEQKNAYDDLMSAYLSARLNIKGLLPARYFLSYNLVFHDIITLHRI